MTQTLYAATFGRGIWSADVLDGGVVATGEVPTGHLEVTISPNPNKGYFELALENMQPGELKMELIDVMGRVVYSVRLNANSGRDLRQQLHLDLPSGAYYLNVENGGQGKVKKFLVVD